MNALSVPPASSGSVPPASGDDTGADDTATDTTAADGNGADNRGAEGRGADMGTPDPTTAIDTGPAGASVPPFPPPVAAPDRDSRNLAVIAHLSSLIAFTSIPSFVGPLAVWLLQRDRDPFVEEHAREALNFNLSVLLYAIALIAFAVVTFGIGLLVLVPVALVGAPAWLIATGIAAAKAGNGERFRYPLSIRFLR